MDRSGDGGGRSRRRSCQARFGDQFDSKLAAVPAALAKSTESVRKVVSGMWAMKNAKEQLFS